MIHYNTTNRSFVLMHCVLKEMGIRNNTFMLQLYDRDLIDVDPFDEDLPLETQLKVHYEISRNIWYYFREIVRIPSTGQKVRFQLNRGNMAIIWAFSLNLDFSALLPRQSYKSSTIVACYNWSMYWGSKNSEALFLAHTKKLAVQNLERLKELSENYPKYIDLRRKNKDKDNVNSITYEPGGYVNKIKVTASATSRDHANKIGRGASTREQFYDEVAFIKYIDTIYGAAIYAYMTVAKMSELTGEPHHLVMTTTAGSKLTEHGRWAYDLFYNAAQFNDNLYDMTTVDNHGNTIFDRSRVLEYINTNSKKIRLLHIEYMYYDLSKGDDYLEEMKRQSDSEQVFRREVLNEWDDDVEGHPLGNVLLGKIREHKKSPTSTVVVDNVYFLNLYKPADWVQRNSDHVVIGVDCATNTGNDFSTFVAVDISTGETVATMRTNAYEIVRYSYAVLKIMISILPRSVIVVERNHVGAALLSLLTAKLPPNRIYHDDDGKPGVYMTKSFRNQIMYGLVFKSASDKYYNVMYDRYIIDEITDLIVTPDGRVDHKPGGHDDMVIAWLYTMWFCTPMCKRRHEYFNALLFNTGGGNVLLNQDSEVARYLQSSVSDRIRDEHSYVMNNTFDDDNPFSGLEQIVSEMHKEIETELERVDTIELDPTDNLPELTGDADKDSSHIIEDKINDIRTQKRLNLLKNPLKNLNVQKYLDVMGR